MSHRPRWRLSEKVRTYSDDHGNRYLRQAALSPPAAFDYKLGVLEDQTSELGRAYNNLVYVA